MATIKAAALVPGDKFFFVYMCDKEKEDPGTCVTRYQLECVRTVLVPPSLNHPNAVAVLSRDTVDATQRWLFLGENDELVKIPKPGKWQQIYKLLRK